ncbi:MAG TPA: type 4a pilus biogenesis protein PilO [Terriglobales bacterium]|jgi:type IV pilus assembly protein PilO
MANLSELSGIKQWGLALGAALLVSVALFFTYFKTQRDANASAQAALDAKVKENAQLEPYRTKLADMDRQVANLKQQLEIERRIVPDDKEVDGFIKMLDAEALKANVYVRRFTSMPVASKEYYSEVPFELEIDGRYYDVLSFFDQVSKLERIVNISNLQVANTRKPSDAKAKHTYQYAPNESIVATCVATTFFSHDTVPAVVPAKAKGRI